MKDVERYGIGEQQLSVTRLDRDVEQIALRGYAVVDSGYDASALDELSAVFERARQRMEDAHGGRAALEAIDEHFTIRLPMLYEPLFLELATNPSVVAVARRMIADYVILNQQNGVINPAAGARYNQGRYHRDLPYQHFVSSRPLALTALFCLDPFTLDNGATRLVPGSHRLEAFPSEAAVQTLEAQVTASAGSFIVFDSMVFHAGGVNRTDRDRRAVNHVYTIPLIRQQIDLPTALGPAFTGDPSRRRLLGYELTSATNVAEYYAGRRSRKST